MQSLGVLDKEDIDRAQDNGNTHSAAVLSVTIAFKSGSLLHIKAAQRVYEVCIQY